MFASHMFSRNRPSLRGPRVRPKGPGVLRCGHRLGLPEPLVDRDIEPARIGQGRHPNPAVGLGLAMGACGLDGRDKLTLIAPPALDASCAAVRETVRRVSPTRTSFSRLLENVC